MRILLTGATGFIGKKLLQNFCELNYKVAIHIRKPLEGINPDVVVFSGELIHHKEEIIAYAPQYVFHLAGSSIYPINFKGEETLWNSNVLYGNTLLNIIREISGLIFVNFTTSLTYNGTLISPYSYYALTKANFIESLEYHVRFNSMRVFNLILYTVYGKEDHTKRAINYIVESLNAKTPISMSPGEQQLDFIHVDDVIGLCIQLLEKKPVTYIENIHVGTGIGTTLKQAASLIELYRNQKANIQFGAIPYRDEEKMMNIAPVANNRFWQSTIPFEKGIVYLFNLQ